MVKKDNFLEWFKTKKTMGIFAVVSLISGFFFIGQTAITGYVIFEAEPSLNLLPIIGALLIFCSVVLGTYSLKKK